MTAQNPKNDTTKQADAEAPLSIDIDAREFFQFVEDTDWSDEQKAEYITLIWDIVFDLVMCGVTVKAPDTAQNACGKLSENGADEGIQARTVVNSSRGQLIEKFVRLSPSAEGPSEKEVTNG